MAVRCKFMLTQKTEGLHETHGLEFSAVTDGSEENKKFFKWTPGGKLTFYSVNKSAVDQLKVGEQYYLDITEAK